MKSIKELNKIAEESLKSIRLTIDEIVDAQSFIEMDRYIRSETRLGEATGEGVVSGIATVNNVTVGIFAISGEILKGSIGKANAQKIVKCIKNTIKMEAPLIAIVDTLGARFLEGIEALEGYGNIISAFSKANSTIPTILVTKGKNYGMLSYLSSLCDITICCDGSVTATTSPLVLVANSTEDEKKVGTADVMSKSGIASLIVKNDKELGKKISEIVSLLCYPIIAPTDDGNRVCKNLVKGIDVHAMIAEIFDKNTFVEVKQNYASEVVTGFARINGIAVGIIANDGKQDDGRLTPKGANKISDLLFTCEGLGLPIVNMVDSKGAKNCLACQGELIKDIGNVMFSYNSITTPKVALIVNNAIGLGYTLFASKSVCDYTLAWENATIGIMDSKAVAELEFISDTSSPKKREEEKQKFANIYHEENTSAIAVAEKGYIDNVILPNHSRQYIIGALQAFISKR